MGKQLLTNAEPCSNADSNHQKVTSNGTVFSDHQKPPSKNSCWLCAFVYGKILCKMHRSKHNTRLVENREHDLFLKGVKSCQSECCKNTGCQGALPATEPVAKPSCECNCEDKRNES